MQGKVWDITALTLSLTHCLDGHIGCITSLAMSRTRVVSGSRDRCLGVWDVSVAEAQQACRGILPGHSRAVNAVRISADATLAATTSDDGTLRLWDLSKLVSDCTVSVPGQSRRWSDVAVDFERKMAITCDRYEGELHLWDLHLGVHCRKVATLPDIVLCRFLEADFLTNRVLLGTGLDTAKVIILDILTGYELAKVEIAHAEGVKLFEVTDWTAL